MDPALQHMPEACRFLGGSKGINHSRVGTIQIFSKSMTRMKRFKARFKREKCKFKRCTYRRTLPVEKPKYCIVHVEKLGIAGFATLEYNGTGEQISTKPTLKQKIKSFIFVDK